MENNSNKHQHFHKRSLSCIVQSKGFFYSCKHIKVIIRAKVYIDIVLNECIKLSQFTCVAGMIIKPVPMGSNFWTSPITINFPEFIV